MKKLMSVLLAATLLVPAVGVAHGTHNHAQTASSKAATPKAKGVWIDVRSAEEFAEGHLNGAVNIPVSEIAAKIAKVSPNKNAPVNLYCRSGNRAEVALRTLKEMGYTNVTNHGGYDDLVKKGVR